MAPVESNVAEDEAARIKAMFQANAEHWEETQERMSQSVLVHCFVWQQNLILLFLYIPVARHRFTITGRMRRRGNSSQLSQLMYLNPNLCLLDIFVIDVLNEVRVHYRQLLTATISC